MEKIFTDLLLTVSLSLPIFIMVLLLASLVVYAIAHFWPDDNDRKLKEYEKLRQTNLQQRMTQEPAEPTLAEFYQTFEDEPPVPPILPEKPKRKPRAKKVA